MPTLTIPDEMYRRLAARAVQQSTTVDDLAALLLTDDDLNSTVDLDTDYLAECSTETTPVPTLAEVQALTATLPSLSAAFISERDE